MEKGRRIRVGPPCMESLSNSSYLRLSESMHDFLSLREDISALYYVVKKGGVTGGTYTSNLMEFSLIDGSSNSGITLSVPKEVPSYHSAELGVLTSKMNSVVGSAFTVHDSGSTIYYDWRFKNEDLLSLFFQFMGGERRRRIRDLLTPLRESNLSESLHDFLEFRSDFGNSSAKLKSLMMEGMFELFVMKRSPTSTLYLTYPSIAESLMSEDIKRMRSAIQNWFLLPHDGRFSSTTVGYSQIAWSLTNFQYDSVRLELGNKLPWRF